MLTVHRQMFCEKIPKESFSQNSHFSRCIYRFYLFTLREEKLRFSTFSAHFIGFIFLIIGIYYRRELESHIMKRFRGNMRDSGPN